MDLSDIFAPHFREAHASLALQPAPFPSPIPYPFKSMSDGEVDLASALVFPVKNVSNGNEHNVVFACRAKPDGEPDWFVWCGDSFLEGTLKAETAPERIIAVRAARPDLPAATTDAMVVLSGALPRSSPCNFWAKWHKGEACKHVKHAIYQVRRDDVAALAGALAAMTGGAAPAVGATPAPVDWRERLPFRVPVLLQGDRGSGKTHDAFAFARARGLPVVPMPGHEGVTSIDMLGHLVPYGPSEFVWKDGKLAHAFRRAARGEKVVLVLDELLRIPQRELSILLFALTPIDGCYHLSTGRIVRVEDGVATEEVISCPVENLAVFATTNVGAQFAVDELDPAIAERFVPLQQDTNEARLLQILLKETSARRFGPKTATALVAVYRALCALVAAGSLNRAPTTRTLVRAIQLAPDVSQLADAVLVQRLLWVDLDSRGRPDETQLKTVEEVVRSHLGGLDATAS